MAVEIVLSGQGGEAFPWLESQLASAPGVRRLRVGERSVLFCERRQQLFELNATADTIWRSLAAGHAPSMVVHEVRALGASPAEALSFVIASARSWLAAGLLAPAEVAARCGQTPDAEIHLRLSELTCTLALHGPAHDPLWRELELVFTQFLTARSEGSAHISLVCEAGHVFLFFAGAPLGLFTIDQLIPEVKAILTEAISRSLSDGWFLLHAALLRCGHRGLLISGAPGAGKTTLALALAARGLGYGSDDIVTVSPAGHLRGIPFSPAVKSGGWELAAAHAPQVLGLPIHRRGDGQQVRYVPIDCFAEGDVETLGWALILDRRPDAKPRIEPVEPLAMIAELISGAYCPSHVLRADTLDAFAAGFAGVDCRRLIYADVTQAVALIEGMIGE